MENSKARLVMLAVSGLLFGASGLGWYMHQNAATSNAYTAISVPPVETPVASAQGTAEAVSRSARETTQPSPRLYTATQYEAAMKAARESMRRDPVAPLTAATASARRYTPATATAYVPPPPETRLIDPPRAQDPSLYNQQPAPYVVEQPAYESPRHNKLTLQDFRLVGLIDGKAIFKIRQQVAQDLGLNEAFTLGKGESFNNIKVEKVDAEKATVRDGTAVATKELSAIH
jgi:hypothetical protein